MTEDKNQSSGPSEPEDLGTPIVQLLNHAVPVSPNFHSRISRAIERRVLAADATQFGILAPLSALLELVKAVFEGLGIVDAASDVHNPRPASSTDADHPSSETEG